MVTTPSLKPVNEIYADFLLKKFTFHKREEYESFHEALKLFMDEKFLPSASLCAVLYERIFTTRLINETAKPPGFIPSKENCKEQLDNLLQRTNQVINIDKLAFSSITKMLVKAGVIDTHEKKEYDDFYREVRNPVSHGLTARLFEASIGRQPANTFEIDANYEKIYQDAAHKLIDKIYYLMAIKVLRKQKD